MLNASPVVLLEISLRTSAIYMLLVLGVRLCGKREIGQMTPFDLVVLLLISNAVQNAMTGPDTTLSGGIVAAATLLLLNRAASIAVARNSHIRRWLVGVPVVLVREGHIQFDNLDRELVTQDELMESLREHDCDSLGEVALATLEVDGEVSVIRASSGAGARFHRSKKRLVRHHKA